MRDANAMLKASDVFGKEGDDVEILKKNNWSIISEAYQFFINTGEIIPNSVRPVIERSWLRSQSINPWTPRPEPVSEREYEQALAEQKELVEFAGPVLQYMYATNNQELDDNFVHLANRNGLVLQVFTRAGSFPSSFKKIISEKTCGTTTTGVALTERSPIELGGQEMYKVCYQSNYGGAAPIIDGGGNLLGAVSLFNNYGKIPDQPLEFVNEAALLIADMLDHPAVWRKDNMIFNMHFTRMMDYVKEAVLIVDKNGVIVKSNQACHELVGADGQVLFGKHCREFGVNLDELISDSTYANSDHFTLEYHKGGSISCLLHNNKTIRWLNGEEHTILLFNMESPPQRRNRVTVFDGEIGDFANIIGHSQIHQNLLRKAKRAAQVSANVLLDGESGTGKDVLARAIHNSGSRALKPFIAINCGSIPREILSSELFGYEEGAFTGGKKGGHVGKLENADGGTVFLDEIGEMPLEMQVSLLRFLQDRAITRVGGHQTRTIDVRIIAATNRDLPQRIRDGLFREDLYFRLKVIQITLPPLRERRDDILTIADYYVEQFAKVYGLPGAYLSQETRNLLHRYQWTGNIRELVNVIENAIVFANSAQITPDLLPKEVLEYQQLSTGSDVLLAEQRERETIILALYSTKGNVLQAAKKLGISRNTIYRKIDKYGLHHLK